VEIFDSINTTYGIYVHCPYPDNPVYPVQKEHFQIFYNTPNLTDSLHIQKKMKNL